MRYQIIPANQAHVEAMLPFVRQADRDEVLASAGKPIESLLGECVRTSVSAWVGLVDGEPICLFGLASPSLLSDTGIPWMIGTDGIDQYSKAFLRRSLWVVAMWRSDYPVLRNWVDVRNKTAIRWLRWLGFTLNEPEPYGVAGLPFHPFEMRN